MFTLGHKDSILNDMVVSAKAMIGAGERRLKYANDWKEIGPIMSHLVVSQSPDVAEKMTAAVTILNQVSEVEGKLAQDEMRNGEDFRDVIERYEVLFRTNEVYLESKQRLRSANEDLDASIEKDKREALKPTYERNRPKLEISISKAKDGKRVAVEKSKEAIRNLINAREKYTRFKVRRLKQGWIRYGTGLSTTCEKEIELFTRLRNILEDMKKDRTTVSEQSIQKIEAHLEDFVEQNPLPNETPVQEAAIAGEPIFGDLE
jgi:hypothetical protein